MPTMHYCNALVAITTVTTVVLLRQHCFRETETLLVVGKLYQQGGVSVALSL